MAEDWPRAAALSDATVPDHDSAHTQVSASRTQLDRRDFEAKVSERIILPKWESRQEKEGKNYSAFVVVAGSIWFSNVPSICFMVVIIFTSPSKLAGLTRYEFAPRWLARLISGRLSD